MGNAPQLKPKTSTSTDLANEIMALARHPGAGGFYDDLYEPEPTAPLVGELPQTTKGFSTFFKVAQVNDELGLVIGWGIVCKDGGQDYYDVQKNHIPEKAMVEATLDFSKGQRMASEQHERMGAGMIVFSFPMTGEFFKALWSDPDTGLMLPGMPPTPPKTGWIVGCAPDKAMLAKFKSRELTGFSIGGEHVEIDGKPVQ